MRIRNRDWIFVAFCVGYALFLGLSGVLSLNGAKP